MAGSVGPAGGGWIWAAAADAADVLGVPRPGEPAQAPPDREAPVAREPPAGGTPLPSGATTSGLRLAADLDARLAAIDASRSAGDQNGRYRALGEAAVARWAKDGVTPENAREISAVLHDTTRVARAGHNGQDNLAWGIACALERQPEPERLRILGELRASPEGNRLLLDLANAAFATDHVFPEDRRAGALLLYAAHVDLAKDPREQRDAFDRLAERHAALLGEAPTLEAKVRLLDDLVAVSALAHAPGTEARAACYTARRLGQAVIDGPIEELLSEPSGRQALERLSRAIASEGPHGVAAYLQLRVDGTRAGLDVADGIASRRGRLNVYMVDPGAGTPSGPLGLAERPAAEFRRSVGAAEHSRGVGDLIQVLERATQGDRKLQSLQIMSHGSERVIYLGADMVTRSDFDEAGNPRPGETRALLDTLRASLAPGAKLHFTACYQDNADILRAISGYLGNDIVVYGHERYGAAFVPGDMLFRNGERLETPAAAEALSKGLNTLAQLFEAGADRVDGEGKPRKWLEK